MGKGKKYENFYILVLIVLYKYGYGEYLVVFFDMVFFGDISINM